jgi:hypothetical protein
MKHETFHYASLAEAAAEADRLNAFLPLAEDFPSCSRPLRWEGIRYPTGSRSSRWRGPTEGRTARRAG